MIKKILINFISRHLFKMVTEKDFIKFEEKTGRLFIGNHPLSVSEVESISKSAKDLKQNDVYILIMRELWAIGEKKIFFEAGSEHGRSILWTLDLIIKKAESLARLK